MVHYPTKKEILSQGGESAWNQLLEERKQKGVVVPLLSKEGGSFWFFYTPQLLTWISEIEKQRGFLSALKLPQSYRQKIARESLNKEAYYSSRIEGAVTSLEEALLNLKSKKQRYADESMQMIHNNKKALEFLLKHQNSPMTKQMILSLHRILMKNTHKDRPITVGNYRKGPIYVVNGLGQVIYKGPPPAKAGIMMKQFVQWLTQEATLHPLIKAGVAHLYFVHVHPFDDGNGRSARALSNLILLKEGYEFINFLSPSDYFEHHRAKYYQAIRHVEMHGYDLTYFLLYYLEALISQLIQVKKEIGKDQRIINIKEKLSYETYTQLNKRQIKSFRFLLNHSEPLTTKKYCKLNHCSDETARKDFNQLLKLKILKSQGEGRARKYTLDLSSGKK